MTRSKILFYSGQGTCVYPLLDVLQREVDHGLSPIQPVTAAEIVEGRVLRGAKLLVMPGGADRYYCRDLNGHGEDNIRLAVDDGMGYLGNCAGSYYGGARIRFHQGLPDEVTASRLGLVPVTAIGSIRAFGPAYDTTLDSASIVGIQGEASPVRLNCYYHGGPYFEPDPGAEVSTIARYADLAGRPAAVVAARFGAGKAVLMGAHLEQCARDLCEVLDARRDGGKYRHMLDPLRRTERQRGALFREVLTSLGIALRPEPDLVPSHRAVSLALGRQEGIARPQLCPG